MYDKTVTVCLVRITDDTVVSTHVYNDGAIWAVVQIDDTVPEYKTNFRKIDFAPDAPETQYKAVIWFKDVDGTLVKQAESDPVAL